MKKSILFIGSLILSASLFAQTQRLVLLEHFSSATCAPCAAANPTLKATLDANAGKIVAIKYQVGWPSPGNDPMYLRNTVDVNARVNYYSVSAVPHSVFDGNQYTGAPSGITTARINSRYAVPSPFFVDVNYDFSVNYDSIFVEMKVKAAQVVNNPNLKAYAVVTERHIEFDGPASTNGETDFYGVMRKMLPSNSGYVLPADWANQDSIILNFAWKFNYVYNMSEISVVAFVQDNSTKEILQAGYAEPRQMLYDAGITSIINVPLTTCEDSIFPQATIKNFGTAVLDSVKVLVKKGNTAIDTINWYGSLAPNNTANLTLNGYELSLGTNTFTFQILENNETPDFNPNYKSIVTKMVTKPNIITNYQPQGFQATAFPPTDWVLNNPDNGVTWSRKTGTGGMAASTACAKMDFYNSPTNQIDELIMPAIDLSAETSGYFSFNVAYQMYSSTYSDKLEVMVSTDCGNTWTTKYNKAGIYLRTLTTYNTSAFTPTQASHWRTDTVNISQFFGMSNVLIKFKATSKYGNNLYIDDVRLDLTTGTRQLLSDNVTEMNVFPNPTNDKIKIQFNNIEYKNIQELAIFNQLGTKMLTIKNTNVPTHEIDLSVLPSGMYFVRCLTNDGILQKPIQIIR